MRRIDVLLIPLLVTAPSVGVYAAAARVASLASLGLSAVNAWASPEMASAYAGRDLQRLTGVLRTSRVLGFLLVAPLAIAAVAMGGQGLSFFGAGFRKGEGILVVLLLGHAASAVAGPVGAFLVMTGRHWAALRVLTVVLVAETLGVLLLGFHWGGLGAAVAVSSCTVAWNIALSLAIARTVSRRDAWHEEDGDGGAE